MNSLSLTGRFSTFAGVLFAACALKRDPTLRWAYVPIRFRARQGGTNSINLRKIVEMGCRMLVQINRVRK
jgi:hypothetical protein